MKKYIALFLSIFMLLTCGLIFSGCKGDNSTSKNSIENDISAEIKYELMAKVAAYDAIYGKSLVYSSHTITVTKDGDIYKVRGTVTAIEKGTKYTASYSGEATYDVDSDEYDFDIEVGSFR